jgi:hypothetical protein
MAVIKDGNWAFRDPGDDIPDGSTINGGNFSQGTPGTSILVGKTLIINGGNFTNVAQNPLWTINGGNWTQVSLCAHLHPTWLAAGYISAESGNCPHVVDIVTIVGGTDIYIYKDTIQ